MIVLLIKWLFVFAVIATVVFGLSSKQIRTPLFTYINKYKIQLVLIVVAFTAILLISQIGT